MKNAMQKHAEMVLRTDDVLIVKGDWLRIRKMIVVAYGEYFKQYFDSLSKYAGIGKKRWEVGLEILRSELYAFYGFDYGKLLEGFERTRKRIEAELLEEKRKEEKRKEKEAEKRIRLQLDIAKRYDELIAELQSLSEEAKQAGLSLPGNDDDPL